MTRLIALLRGVNVGGRTIKSAELAEVFRALGYDNVKTVLASGNVVFESAETTPIARERIERALSEAFGYDAIVHVLDTASLATIVEAYPFEDRDGWHRYAVFLIGAQGAAVSERGVQGVGTEGAGTDGAGMQGAGTQRVGTDGAGTQRVAGETTVRSPEHDALVARILQLPVDAGLEAVADGGTVIYWTVERGHTLDSVVGKGIGSGKAKSLTTNRNLNTLRKLLA